MTEEKTMENLIGEMLDIKVDDKQVFQANVIRVKNEVILTSLTATMPVVVQRLEVDEDGELVRARNEKGQYVADNPDTVENEAFKEEE
jgi:hypothetical protein|tara:strand:+ start:291 stop:554 length:264 start_codon:yes stop_codon:yes gene_type:complete